MGDTINLPYYQTANRTFGDFADVDGSKANTAVAQQRTLLFGQMLPGSLADTSKGPILVTSLGQVGLLTGVGSMIYEMVRQYLASDSFGELWIFPIPDPTGAVAANGAIGFTGQATAQGIISLYIGGVLVASPVIAGESLQTSVVRLAGVANALPDLPVVLGATATPGQLAVVAKHAGLLGNDIDIRMNYQGPLGGEVTPPGLTVAIVPMSTGAGAPTFTAALPLLGDVTYDFIGLPYTDAATLTAFDQFFNFANGRWSWQQMLYGGYFTAYRGTPGQLASFGNSRNGPNGSCLGFYDMPAPSWVVTAEYTAQCAYSLRTDPNKPLQNVVLNLQAPPRSSAFVRSNRNTLLYDGISTYTVNRAGQVILERAVTFYQTNTAGAADNSYLDVETMYGVPFLIRSWQQEMLRLFPRSKLFQDGNPIPAGAMATSAAGIRVATIAWYRAQCAAGNAQNPDQFAAAVLAQNSGNGLVKALLPFIIPNQLRAIAGLVQFTKP